MQSFLDVHLISLELLNHLKKMVNALPLIFFGIIILVVVFGATRVVHKLLLIRNKHQSSLLREVIARAISIFVFLLGIYLVFEMAGLTTMALTIISGTGLIGLTIGIAFRDIAENFLASILLSVQNPFHSGDLIDIVCPVTGYSVTGYVQRLTLRVTILLSPEGNHLQITNATVYKSTIRNYTTNPTHREEFFISIRPDVSVSYAEEIALRVITHQEAILKDPEACVLVDGLVRDAINLKIYYWIDTRKYNPFKVKSTVIRLIKEAFLSENIDFASQIPLPPSPLTKKKTQIEEKRQTTSEKETSSDSRKSVKARLPEKGGNLLRS